MSHHKKGKHMGKSVTKTPQEGQQIFGPVGIPPPPDYIFKFRKNRQAPAQEVWGAGTVTYLPERAEYLEGIGNFVYYKGVDLPSRTVAPVEAIFAINIPKRITVQLLKFIATLHKRGRVNRFFQYYAETMELFLQPFYLEDAYYCKPAKEIRKLTQGIVKAMGVVEEVASRIAEMIAMVIEFDNAYRWRIQDLAGEASKEALRKNLPKELKRLIGILGEREAIVGGGQHVVQRFKNGARIVNFAWYIPTWRKKMRKALEDLNLDNLKMDQADIYHTLLYGDYHTGGKNQEERFAMYRAIHGIDMATWPPRIIIRSNTA